MLRTVSALLGLCLVLPAAALAQPPAAPGDYGAPPPGYGAGGGGGGGMTLQAFQAKQRGRMMRLDTNRDGRISMAEYAAKAGHNGRQHDPQKTFAKFDLNHDGFLEPNEIDQMSARKFQRLDRNHDGVVTRDERHGQHGGGDGPMGPGQQPPMQQPR